MILELDSGKPAKSAAKPSPDLPTNGGKTNVSSPATGRVGVAALPGGGEVKSAAARTDNSVLGTESSVPSAQLPAENVTYKFAGTVVDEQKQPVAGAKIALNYFRKLPTTNAVPAAITDNRGKFDFSMKSSDFSDAVTGGIWFEAGLIAAKDGYGFAFAPAVFCESSGRLNENLERLGAGSNRERRGQEIRCSKAGSR